MRRKPFQTNRLRPWVLAAALAAATLGGATLSGSRAEDVVPASLSPGAPASVLPMHGRRAPYCPLCALAPEVPVVRLSSRDALALGYELSANNERQIARIDSLYRIGCFGAPGSEDARHGAHLMTRLATANAYSYMVRLATDTTCVYEASESTLVKAFGSFADPGIYPITRLRRARMGYGSVCLQYDLRGTLDSLAVLGDRTVRVRVRSLDLGGRPRRVLSMMLPTGLDQEVEVLVAEHYSCSIARVETAGDDGAYELYLLDDMQGLWLRKWGTHEPRALMFWTTPGTRVRCALPESPRVGVRIYVPKLVLRLPLLPDLGFDDLREIDLPQPVLRLGYVRAGSHPDWLAAGPRGGFRGWSGHGPVPAGVRARFPDF